MLAYRGSARCDENVGAPFACTLYRLRYVLYGVVGDAEVMDFSAFSARQRHEGKAVGVNNLTGFGRAARRHQLVTSSQHGDPRFAVYAEARMIHGCGEHHITVA